MSDEKSLAVRNSALALSPRKSKALQGLKEDMPLGKAAKFAGINRTTLRRWMLTDAIFIAAYNEWKARTLVGVEGILVAAGPAAARRLARSARTSDKAAAELLKAVDKIQQRGLGATSASEVAEERMLAEEKRRVVREMKKQKILDQNLQVLYETSRRKEAMEEAEFEQGLRAQLERPKAPDPKALPPAPVEPAKLALPEPSTKPTPDAPAPPPTAMPDPAPPEPEAPQPPAAPEPAAAAAGDDDDEDADTTEIY